MVHRAAKGERLEVILARQTHPPAVDPDLLRQDLDQILDPAF